MSEDSVSQKLFRFAEHLDYYELMGAPVVVEAGEETLRLHPEYVATTRVKGDLRIIDTSPDRGYTAYVGVYPYWATLSVSSNDHDSPLANPHDHEVEAVEFEGVTADA